MVRLIESIFGALLDRLSWPVRAARSGRVLKPLVDFQVCSMVRNLFSTGSHGAEGPMSARGPSARCQRVAAEFEPAGFSGLMIRPTHDAETFVDPETIGYFSR
jgi:hypothetical protein